MTDYSRQIDIMNPDMIVFPITIIGLGHIGSNAANELASLGFKEFTLYDDDKVGEENFPGQHYRDPIDLGKLKVKATEEILHLFHGKEIKIKTCKEKFSRQKLSEGIIICGVDSMETRADIWRAIRMNLSVPLYIDARTGGEIVECHTVRPCQIEDIEYYEKTLEYKAAELPCGGRSIGYAGRIIAGLIASQCKRWIKNEEYYQKILFNITEGIFIQDNLKNEEGGEKQTIP